MTLRVYPRCKSPLSHNGAYWVCARRGETAASPQAGRNWGFPPVALFLPAQSFQLPRFSTSFHRVASPKDQLGVMDGNG
jgi:hypothetical protein